MDDDSNLSISTGSSSHKEEMIASKILGQFYSLENSILCQASVNLEQNFSQSDGELMDIDECSKVGSSDDIHENQININEEEPIEVEEISGEENGQQSLCEDDDVFSSNQCSEPDLEYRSSDDENNEENIDENIQQEQNENVILEDDNNIDEAQDPIDPIPLFVMPENMAAEIPQQSDRSQIPSKSKQRKTGPLTTGLIQRIRMFRATENFARFRAFQDGTTNGRQADDEYPTSNQILNEWGIGLIVSKSNPNKAILRKQINL